MATKDFLPFKNKHDAVFINGTLNDQYNNLNLNQKIQTSSNAFSEFSKNVSTEKRKLLNYDFEKNDIKKDSHSWKKASNNLSSYLGNNDFENENELKKEKISTINGSTLSLHIAAYEKMVEDSSSNLVNGTKEESSKQLFGGSKFVIQNPFEFPRQQENGRSQQEPEIGQFRASQRLFNPNRTNQRNQRSNGSSTDQTNQQRPIPEQPRYRRPLPEHNGGPREYLNVTDNELCAYMTLLGIDNLTIDNLNLCYRALIRTQHVDKGGDLQTTQAITQAYRILKSCLENNRYIPSKNPKSGPSSSRNANNFDHYQAYAETEDSWEQYSKCFKPKSKNPKYFFKPTKFDRAFQNGWQHPEDAEDPINSDLGRARSRPKKYNNGYIYDDEDEYIPNDQQNYSTKNDGEPRVIRGGLELRKPLSGIELPDNYDQLSQSDIILNELTKVDLQTNPQLEELFTLLSSFERDPSFDTLIQRTRTFIYLDWAQSNQSDTTQYQNIAIEQNKLGAITITLPQFEDDDIVDDRLKEGAIIQLYSCNDITIKAKATVETVDWDLHKITISFLNKGSGDKLISCRHRCNISMAPSRFIYRAFIRGLNGIVHNQMIDYIYPDPQFDEPYEEFSNISEQRICDRTTHQQSGESILFNHNQETAIDAIVNGTCGNYPFLLFGPPGTGKTATLVECIHRITKLGKDKRILVCTPSNMAADVIAATILQRGIIDEKYVFRLNSLSFEYKKRNKMLDSIACIVKEGSNHCFGIPSLRNLQVFRVIITTLTSSTYLSMAGGLRGYFSHILIDECAQATEQELMIPIGNLAVPGKTTVALYGDPKQLGAVDKIPVLGEFGYNQSMMERLLKLPAYKSGDHRLFVMLEQNYRTHGLILRPASRLFYAQKLISMKTDKSLYGMCGWPELPNPSFPVIFHSIRGSREIRSATSSYKNHYENDLCLDYIKKLLKYGVELHEIGIISPYKFQCTMIKDCLQHYKLYGVTVNSVEGFQGSERRVIIFLTTRTNSMGFLSCDKRLNTSITRAQQLLIILGDEVLLGQHIAWKHFIHYCRFHGGFKESTLLGASPSHASSPPPGFKAITCQTTAPPGFEKPETTGVPVDVECGKNINTAYNNTTDEMKAEYDIDDDHDFDLSCNVGAAEYINFQGRWVDETIEVENIEPEARNGYYRENYEAERVHVYQNDYSNNIAEDEERNVYYDTYEELPRPSASPLSHPPGYEQQHLYDDYRNGELRSSMGTVRTPQPPHPYDDYEEPPLAPVNGERAGRYEARRSPTLRSQPHYDIPPDAQIYDERIDRNQTRNYQHNYQYDSDMSPPVRERQPQPERNRPSVDEYLHGFDREEQRHPSHQNQNGHDIQHSNHHDAYRSYERNPRLVPVETQQRQPHRYDNYEEASGPYAEANDYYHRVSRNDPHNYQYDYNSDPSSTARYQEHDRHRHEDEYSRQLDDYYYQEDLRHLPPQHDQQGYDTQYSNHIDGYRNNERSTPLITLRQPYRYDIPRDAQIYDDRFDRNHSSNGRNNQQNDYNFASVSNVRLPHHDRSQQNGHLHQTDYYSGYGRYQDYQSDSPPNRSQNGYDTQYSNHFVDHRNYERYSPYDTVENQQQPHPYDDYEEAPLPPVRDYDERVNPSDLRHSPNITVENEQQQFHSYHNFEEPRFPPVQAYEDRISQNGVGHSPLNIIRNQQEQQPHPSGVYVEPLSVDQVDLESGARSRQSQHNANPPEDENSRAEGRKLSSDDLDDIAALNGNGYRFLAETSDTIFEVDDFSTLADEILEKLKNTSDE